MWNFSCTIACNAWVFTTILNHNMTDIDVANNITMDRYVLANEKSVSEKVEKK